MEDAKTITDLTVILTELQSARTFLDRYAKYEGSLTGHIAVVIAAVREDERTRLTGGES